MDEVIHLSLEDSGSEFTENVPTQQTPNFNSMNEAKDTTKKDYYVNRQTRVMEQITSTDSSRSLNKSENNLQKQQHEIGMETEATGGGERFLSRMMRPLANELEIIRGRNPRDSRRGSYQRISGESLQLEENSRDLYGWGINNNNNENTSEVVGRSGPSMKPKKRSSFSSVLESN